MEPFLSDEGVPRSVARACRVLGLEAYVVGEPETPPRGSSDRENAKWCAERGAILLTNDRGKKDKAILDALAELRVHALFVHEDLLSGPPHLLARALLNAEGNIDAKVGGRGLLHHRLRASGGLDPR